MIDHGPSHEERLSRLATGELSREDPEFEELVRCPQCRGEALASVEMLERLDDMERERRAILAGVERAEEDPAIRKRVDQTLAMAAGFAPVRRGRRARMWVLALAAAVILGGFLALRLWSSRGAPGVARESVLLGDSAIAFEQVVPDHAGGLLLRASRNARASCTLVFVVEQPPDGDVLHTCESSAATCTVPAERMSDWPATVDLHVEERDASNEPLAASPRVSYTRK